MRKKRASDTVQGAGRALVIAIGVTLVVGALQLAFPAPELASYNARVRLESALRPVPMRSDIAMINIDDASLLAHGRWPWPRQYWADIVDALAELKARAVFFDVTFPEPISPRVQTPQGRRPLADAINFRATGVRTMLESELFSAIGRTGDTTAGAFVDRTLARGFGLFVSEVRALTAPPDELMGTSVRLARQAGVVTGGVMSVPDVGTGARAARARTYRRALRWILDHPGRPVDELPAEDRAELGDQLATLRGTAELFPVFARDLHADMYSSAVPAALRQVALERSTEVKRELVEAVSERAVSGADLAAVDRERLFRTAVPAPYRELGTFTETVFDQTLSRALLARGHLWPVEGAAAAGLPAAVSVALPTFEIARGFVAMGLDWEAKDPDGNFRSVPLLVSRDDAYVPTGGLALWLALRAAETGERPRLRIDGAQLAIEAKGEAPVRVPLLPGGRMLIHWVGPYAPAFGHVSAGTLLTYAGLRKDRLPFLFEKIPGRLPLATALIELLRPMRVEAPDAPLSLAQLVRGAADRLGEVSAASLLLPRLPSTPASVDEVRTPAQWDRFLREYWDSVVSEFFAAQIPKLKKKLEEPGLPEAKAAKYRPLLADLERAGPEIDALRAELARRIEGKICFIGHTATSSTDLAAMPFSTAYPKVGAYPTVLNTLSSGRFVRRPWTVHAVDPSADNNPGVQLLPLFLACLASALSITALSARRGIAFSTLLIVGWLAVSAAALVYGGLWLDAVAPVLGVVLTHGAVFSHSYGRTENIRRMFESYVDPHIVGAILEDESLWTELGGREQEITAFFSDIAGFTTLSELLGAQELSEMLTDYLSPMTDIILSHDGIRDKYIGDAIVAFFGAPIVAPGHELNACLSAIEQQRHIVELKERWKRDRRSWYENIQKHGKDLEFRIGLNTGRAKVGNFGAHNSKNYTMIGDTVNLAARLEGANKEYGSFVMCGERTIAACRDHIVHRELDRLVVKGKIEAVRVFEVIGRTGQVDAYWPELLGTYAAALAAYHARDFVKARELFSACGKMRPGDGPAGVYVERCEEFIEHPPAPDWNGAYVMTHK